MRFTTQVRKIFSPSAKGERASGHYWVLWSGRLGGRDIWRIGCYLQGSGWKLTGDDRAYYDNDFMAINESRIEMFHSKYWWLAFWITVGMTILNFSLAIFYHINNTTK